MNNLPKEYTELLPRVSSIVEFAYPFKGEDKERFLEWLWRKDIEFEDYMEEASSGGRFVHLQLENYIKGVKIRPTKYKGYIDNGLAIINSGEYEFIATEEYIRTKDYQGTIDCIVKRVSDGKYGVLDWKTYGLAKAKFNLANKYKKPYDKLKKASLQLSLYKKGYTKYELEFAIIAELGNDYHYLHPIDFWEDSKLEELIEEYKLTIENNASI